MQPDAQSQLLQINRSFYDRFAKSFSATRQRAQSGVSRIIGCVDRQASLLDAGCGNGTLARALIAQGFTGRYVGLDFSERLLASAETLLGEPVGGSYTFQQVDLAYPNWQAALPPASFDWLVAFAVLHHLPGENLRQQTVQAFRELVNPIGYAAVSVWQWQNSPRLRKRVLPWSTVGLDPGSLDAGDVLLDWRAGDTPGLRYVHTFTEASLIALAVEAGFRVVETFYSDGKTGDLALYQVWRINPE